MIYEEYPILFRNSGIYPKWHLAKELLILPQLVFRVPHSFKVWWAPRVPYHVQFIFLISRNIYIEGWNNRIGMSIGNIIFIISFIRTIISCLDCNDKVIFVGLVDLIEYRVLILWWHLIQQLYSKHWGACKYTDSILDIPQIRIIIVSHNLGPGLLKYRPPKRQIISDISCF